MSRDDQKRPLCVGAHWQELRIESQDSRDHASVVKAADGSVIVWGGMGHYRGDDTFVFRNDGWRYFPDTGELRRIEGGPPRENPYAVALGDEVLIGGGSPPSGEAATDIASYSLESDSWSTLTPPVPLASPLGATDDTWWWWTVDSASTQLDLIGYSAASASWTTNPGPDDWSGWPPPALVVGDEVWTWSHQAWEHGPDLLWRYHLDTHETNTVPAPTSALPSPDMHALPALDRVAIWGFGDQLPSLSSGTDGWLVSISTGAWSPMSMLGALPTGYHISTVVDGKRMFVFTGDWMTPGTTGAIYDGDANVWTPLEHECAPPYGVGAASIGDGRFLVWSSAYPDGETPYETAHIYTP